MRLRIRKLLKTPHKRRKLSHPPLCPQKCGWEQTWSSKVGAVFLAVPTCFLFVQQDLQFSEELAVFCGTWSQTPALTPPTKALIPCPLPGPNF